MSELLLQGATMTNEHCENCGDPLFRDGERTFCPTCGGAKGGDAAEQTPQEVQSEPEPQSRQPARTTTAPQQAGPVDAQSTPSSEATRRPEPASTPEGDDPRAELQRAVTRSARKANEATDPRTAKQWLEAATEAAEALDALSR